MKKRLKKLWRYLNEAVSITFTPSPKYKIRTYRVRRLVPIVIITLIIGTISTLGILYKYYESHYFTASETLTTLIGVRDENLRLKNDLIILTEDTEELRQSLEKLKNYNQEIREMIDISQKKEDNDDLQLRTVFSYNQSLLQQGLPMGGGEYHLYYQEPQELINKMQNNLAVVRDELPTQQQDLGKLESSVKEYNARMKATPTIWPLADNGQAYISSEFGWRNNPTSGGQGYHEGLDIATWYNTPVMATAYGKVILAGWSSGYGWNIEVDHGFGFKTRYAHLNKIKVKKGQQVSRGQVIGLSGNSGRSTGPHLHYEVKVNNIPQNPRKYTGGN